MPKKPEIIDSESTALTEGSQVGVNKEALTEYLLQMSQEQGFLTEEEHLWAERLIHEDHPRLMEIELRGRAAREKLLSGIREAIEEQKPINMVVESPEPIWTMTFLESLLRQGERVQVEVSNWDDPESSLGLGVFGPIFYLHGYERQFISAKEVADIRREALTMTTDKALHWMYLHGMHEEIEAITEKALSLYPLDQE